MDFVPHLRNLDHQEEPSFFEWLKKLRNMDGKANTIAMALGPAKKAIKTKRAEFTATLYAHPDGGFRS
jgi:hypothetical protein